jgi:hypothetical protein
MWIVLALLVIVGVVLLVARNHSSSGQTISHIDGR